MHLVLDRAPAPTHAERVAGIEAGSGATTTASGITACQDALVDAEWQVAYEQLARAGEPAPARARRARVGLGARRRAAGRAGRAARRAAPSAGCVRHGEVLPRRRGREPHGGDARPLPATAPGGRPPSTGSTCTRGRISSGSCACATARGSASTSTRSATARCASRWMRSRRRWRANGRRDARHQLAHVQFAHPDDLPRFRALGVIANVTPLWARLEEYVTELTLPFVSERAAAGMYPFGSILRAGGALAFGSDWSVSTPDPLHQLATAVARRRSGGERGRAAAAGRAHRPRRRHRRAHDRRGARMLDRRGDGLDRAGQARRPGRARPRPLRPRTGRVPGCARPGHPGRGRGRAPVARAVNSNPLPEG